MEIKRKVSCETDSDTSQKSGSDHTSSWASSCDSQESEDDTNHYTQYDAEAEDEAETEQEEEYGSTNFNFMLDQSDNESEIPFGLVGYSRVLYNLHNVQTPREVIPLPTAHTPSFVKPLSGEDAYQGRLERFEAH